MKKFLMERIKRERGENVHDDAEEEPQIVGNAEDDQELQNVGNEEQELQNVGNEEQELQNVGNEGQELQNVGNEGQELQNVDGVAEEDVQNVDIAGEEHELQNVENEEQEVQNVDVAEEVQNVSDTQGDDDEEVATCDHPIVHRGMCVRCGQLLNDDHQSAEIVAFDYIRKDLAFSIYEISRIRNRELQYLFSRKKLCLVIDFDHTLLHSTGFHTLSQFEQNLMGDFESWKADTKNTIFRDEALQMITKLRPFIYGFLEEASKLFEMYIYTLADRNYAITMASYLDPEGLIFGTRVISRQDSTLENLKQLDVLAAPENVVLIIDNSKWKYGSRHAKNVISVESYKYFASGGRNFYNNRSLSESNKDELDEFGILRSVLDVLKRIHIMFYREKKLEDGDVKQLLELVEKEVLAGCVVSFGQDITHNDKFRYRRMAEERGATWKCNYRKYSVTHIVTRDVKTKAFRWAKKKNWGTATVTPSWILEANHYRRRPNDDHHPVEEEEDPAVQ